MERKLSVGNHEMNLLIVDDDKYILEDMEESIDVEKNDISCLFTALNIFQAKEILLKEDIDIIITEILRQYFINHPQSIDKYTFLQNSAFTHWVKEKCSKMC